MKKKRVATNWIYVCAKTHTDTIAPIRQPQCVLVSDWNLHNERTNRRESDAKTQRRSAANRATRRSATCFSSSFWFIIPFALICVLMRRLTLRPLITVYHLIRRQCLPLVTFDGVSTVSSNLHDIPSSPCLVCVCLIYFQPIFLFFHWHCSESTQKDM